MLSRKRISRSTRRVGSRLASGSSSFDLFLPGGSLCFVSGDCFRMVVRLFGVRPSGEQFAVTLVSFQQVATNPRFTRRAAPRVIDQPDRNIECLMELPTEEVTDRRKLTDGFGLAFLPAVTPEVVLRFLRTDLRDGDQPNVCKLCGEFFQVRVVGRVNRPLHV